MVHIFTFCIGGLLCVDVSKNLNTDASVADSPVIAFTELSATPVTQGEGVPYMEEGLVYLDPYNQNIEPQKN